MEIPVIRTAANNDEVDFMGSSPFVSVSPAGSLSKMETIFGSDNLSPRALSENRLALILEFAFESFASDFEVVFVSFG